MDIEKESRKSRRLSVKFWETLKLSDWVEEMLLGKVEGGKENKGKVVLEIKGRLIEGENGYYI